MHLTTENTQYQNGVTFLANPVFTLLFFLSEPGYGVMLVHFSAF